MSINVQKSKDTNVVVISVEGSFEFSQYQMFKDAYSSIEKEGTAFILDLSKATYMDSSALGMVLLLKDHADELLGQLTLSKPSAAVDRILGIAQFSKIMTITR